MKMRCLLGLFISVFFTFNVLAQKTEVVLVGSYTEKMGWVEGTANGIGVYAFDTETGILRLLSTSEYIKNPSYLALHPSKQFVYAVSETGGDKVDVYGKLFAYCLDTISYSLKYINSVSSQGVSPCFVSVDKTGRYALLANYGNGSVSAYAIGLNGELSDAYFTDLHTGKGPRPQQTNAHAHNFITSPDNCYAYSADLGSDQIYVYAFNAQKGLLKSVNKNVSTAKGAGPRQIAFHPFMKMAYAINELNGTIDAFVIDSLSGGLRNMQTVSIFSDSSKLSASGAEIRISPSGKFLYASNRAKYNEIAIYSINQTTGLLTLISHHNTLGKTPRYFTFDPSGKFILIANQDSNNVVVFRIDPESGMFIEPGIVNNVPTPTCLVFY
jgi:6-phosphogluconolactonase